MVESRGLQRGRCQRRCRWRWRCWWQVSWLLLLLLVVAFGKHLQNAKRTCFAKQQPATKTKTKSDTNASNNKNKSNADTAQQLSWSGKGLRGLPHDFCVIEAAICLRIGGASVGEKGSATQGGQRKAGQLGESSMRIRKSKPSRNRSCTRSRG